MPQEIIQADLANKMGEKFLSYAFYVIQDRALPDVRDGLKPVQRRLLYDMAELGLQPNTPYKKSARTVGDTMGKYHPHGDSSIYGALVNLSQSFNMRYMLIDGHGNFGSVDGDPAAAMRYTESRLSHVGSYMLKDIKKDTVDFQPNFDETEREPIVLPSLFPNLLANGTDGIAVGMASSIPPHNVGSLNEALQFIIQKTLEGEEADIEDLIRIVQMPDFPTGGTIINLAEVQKAYRTGKGRAVIRSKYTIEEGKHGEQKIVITEIPYKVNKAKLIEKIDELRKDNKIEGIKEVNDDSDQKGLSIAVTLKKGTNSNFVVKNLLKYTDMQASFSMNHVALFERTPKQFTLKEALDEFLAHVANVILRRTQFDVNKAQARMHIIEGIIIALNDVDGVLGIIKASKNNQEAIATLSERYEMSDVQAKNIIEIKFKSLSQSSIDELYAEKDELEGKINIWNSILTDEEVLLHTMSSELNEMADKFSSERKTDYQEVDGKITDRELIKDQDLVITISEKGIIKAVDASEYQSSSRGTKGQKNAKLKEDDNVKFMFMVNSRDDLLIFTNKGRCHLLEVYKLPIMKRSQQGKYLANYISFEDEEIVNILPKTQDDNQADLLLITRFGIGKRLELSELSSRMRSTKVITFKENDELVDVVFIEDGDEVLTLTASGQAVRFNPNAEGSKGIRPMGRAAAGVRVIKLAEDDFVIKSVVVESEKQLLLITENGYGKRVEFEEFSTLNRGAKGVRSIGLSDKTGILVDAASISDEELFIATVDGIVNRIKTDDIRTMGRQAAGVKVINLNENDAVLSISLYKSEADIEGELTEDE